MRGKKKLEGLKLSKRLVARLGALLVRKVDVTEAVLELARPRSTLSKVLTDQQVLKDASALDSVGLARLCGKHGVEEETKLQIVEGEGWRTIALSDEVLAEAAWEEESSAAAEPARGEIVHRGRFRAEEAAAEELFTAKEMERLKLQALTSAEPKEKVEAIRKLSFAPIPDGEKAEFFLGRLSDPDSPVRTEAAQLLVQLGLSQDIADAIRELEEGTEKEKLFAVGRMSKILAQRARGVEIGAGLRALIGRLREERSAPVRRGLLECLEEASPVISTSPEHERQLIRLLISILPQDFTGLDVPVRRVLRALGRHAPERVTPALWDELDKTADRRIAVHLLMVLSFLPDFVGKERLAAALAGEIAKPEESEVDFRALGGILQRMGGGAIGPLLSVFKRANRVQKRYIVRLLGDTCRFESVPAGLKEDTAELCLRILEGEDREVRMAVMETQLPCDMELSDETRTRLASAFLENVHAFSFPADVENVEYTIARMGMGAAGPIIMRLDPKLPSNERVRAVRLLGELCRVESERGTRGSGEPMRILRTLQRLSFEDFPDKGELLIAIGRICSTRFISRKVVEVVARNVWQNLEEPEMRVSAYEAMGLVASSRRSEKRRVREAVETFKQELLKEPPEFSAEATILDDEQVFEIGPEAGHYTDVIPTVVKGLGRITLGHPESKELRVEITTFLIDRWRAMMTGETIWGPGSVGAVIEELKELGSDGRTPVNLKAEIVKALAGRLSSVPVMLALGEVFAADDPSAELGVYASGVAVKLLRRKDETGQFREEERDVILGVLAKIAGRRALETHVRGTENIREAIIEELFAGLRDRVEDTFESLVDLRDRSGLPDELKATVAERLAAYSGLVRY